MTEKITQDHLALTAYVYIRQSTPGQVENNSESRKRQYALRERASALGWSEIVTVDDDLGRSGSGSERPGYDRLVAAVCRGEVGIVFAVEASRLARNGRDWHTLLEFCGLVGTLLADESTIYDPRLMEDRFLLGMKGALSEMEGSAFRQRAQAGLDQKAERGELYTSVPIGYVRAAGDRLEKDPDQRVQEAIALVFRKFRELGTVRQVLLWFHQEGIQLPARQTSSESERPTWKKPVYNTIRKILGNPVYAGAYAFGKTTSWAHIENGRKHVTRNHPQPRESWQVLIQDHHSGYISWAEYEDNQQRIARNVPGFAKGREGAARSGDALLAGLLRCGRCGRKLHAGYSGATSASRYSCHGAHINHGRGKCVSFGGLRPENAVVDEVLRVLQPDGVTAALEALEERNQAHTDKQRHLELALEQARYEADRARKQYDAVDPDNRLVAGELEQRWNAQLAEVQRLEQELAAVPASDEGLSADEKEQLLALGADLRAAWDQPSTTAATKKRLLRAVIAEIVADVDETTIHLTIRWAGGDHTQVQVKKNRTGAHRYQTSADTIALLRELARLMPDYQITSVLNRLGRRTGKGRTWTEGRIRSARHEYGIAVYQPGEMAERGELKLWEAAERLGVNKTSVLRSIRTGDLEARQPCPGAPWIIRRDAVDALAQRRGYGPDRPVTEDPRQKTLDIQ